MSAAMKAILAASEAIVRRVFHIVHSETYRLQSAFPSGDSASTAASASFRGKGSCHHNHPGQIERGPRKSQDVLRLTEIEYRCHPQYSAACCRSHKRQQEPGIENSDVDGLHRRDSLRRVNPGERAHDEGRE